MNLLSKGPGIQLAHKGTNIEGLYTNHIFSAIGPEVTLVLSKGGIFMSCHIPFLQTATYETKFMYNILGSQNKH